MEDALNSKSSAIADVLLVDKESFDYLEKADKRALKESLKEAFKNEKMVALIGDYKNLNQSELYDILEITDDRVIIEPSDEEAKETEQYLTSFSLQKKDDTLYISRSYLLPEYIEENGKLVKKEIKVNKEKIIDSVIKNIKDNVIVEKNSNMLTVNAASNSLVNNYDFKESYTVGNANTATLSIVKTISKAVGTSYTMWGIESADYTEEKTGNINSLVVEITSSKDLHDVRPNNTVGAGSSFDTSLTCSIPAGVSWTIGGTFTNGAGSITDQSSIDKNYGKWKYQYATGSTHPKTYCARSTMKYKNDSGTFSFTFKDTVNYYISGQSGGSAYNTTYGNKTMRFSDRGYIAK